MGSFIGNLTGGLIGTSTAEREAKKGKQEAERQRKAYEAEVAAQREVAILESNKALDNVTNIELNAGSYESLSNNGSMRKKKKTASTMSSALGVR